MYYISFAMVTDSCLNGTIHGKTNLIRYTAEIPAEICEVYECYKYLYVLHMICYTRKNDLSMI